MKIIGALKSDEEITDEYILRHMKRHATGGFADYYNQEFQVYGIHVLEGVPYYFICFDEYSKYPTPICGLFCNILDYRLSSYWRINLYKNYPKLLDITTQFVFEC